MNTKTRIVFFGTPDFAVPSLEALISDSRFSVDLVVTQPDKPIGRHHSVLQKSPIKQLAEKHAIPVHDEPLKNLVHHADCGVLVAYGKIISQNLIDSFKHGIINVHPSLLPKYRGSSPIQAAIRNQDSETGVSIMLLDDAMDHGPILAQETVKLTKKETAGTLHDSLAKLGAGTLSDVVKQYISGSIAPREQNDSDATYTKKLSKSDGMLNWSDKPQSIDAHVRAMSPWPGAWTIWRNKRVLVWKSKNGLPTEVQPEGKKRMPYAEFKKGYPEFALPAHKE